MPHSLTPVQKTIQELVETLINAGVVCTSAADGELLLVPHPLLILGYSRFNFVRASSILNCQSTPRCLALVLSAQSPISDWSKGSSPMRRSVRHGLLRQLNSHSATFNQLPCFGV